MPPLTRAAGLLATLTLTLVLAPSAAATIRTETSLKDGLVLTDVQGDRFDDLQVRLFSTATGLKWEINRVTTASLFLFDIRPGCEQVETRKVVCDRIGSKITANLGGGDDRFFILPESLPVTDTITVNGGDGADRIQGASGIDTLNGGAGNDIVGGRGGGDVLNGNAGNDALRGEGGDDALFGGDGNDKIDLGIGTDTADGGAGDDIFGLGTNVNDGRDEINGGIGADSSTYSAGLTTDGVDRVTELRIIEANLETIGGDKDAPEGDVLRSIEAYHGGADEDIITGALSSNASDYFGEGDDDTIFGSSAANTLVGGAGGDQLDGNAGNDVIDAKAGEGKTADADPVIDCGTGSIDLAIIDLLDDASPSGCENIDRSPAGEGPHVRIRVPRVVRVARGRASFRLTCPRRLRRRCAGTLRLRKGRAGTQPMRYSIRPKRSRRVAVSLGSLEGRLGRRTVARLESVERGRFGPKTTLRRVALRR